MIGYGINPLVAPASLGQIEKPAETVAIAETRYYPPGIAGYRADWGWYTVVLGIRGQNSFTDIGRTGEDGREWTWSQLLLANRHQDGLNVSFADGHAKYHRWERLAVGPNAENFGPWTGQGFSD